MHYMSIAALVASILLASVADASCLCTASGDPHYTMCDGNTKFDYQGEGLHQMFKIDDLEVQCSNSKQKPTAVVTFIDHCRIKFTKGQCDMVIKTADQAGGKLQVNGETVSDASKYSIDDSFKGTKLSSKGNILTANFETTQGPITIIAGPTTFSIVAKGANKCTGMCGTCSGKETKPKNLIDYGKVCASAPAILTGTKCVPTPAPTTASATTAPKTEAPTTMPIASLPPAVAYSAPNNTLVPLHPVFESEAVMKSCVKACMVGEKDQRMKDDVVFASFVENCVYDKALGPGSEKAAMSNMQTYITVVQIAAKMPDNSSWTMPTSYSVPKANFSQILEPVVTKKPSEIGAGEGCTYQLQHTKCDTGAKADYLRMRDSRSTGAATAAEDFTSTEQDSSMSSSSSSAETVEIGSGTATVAHRMKIHLDLEAPIVVVQAAPKVAVTEAPKKQAEEAKKSNKIPISESESQAPASQAPPAPTMAPTAAPTAPPVRQYQVATVVRSRDVPASEIKPAPTPLPEMVMMQPAPAQVMQAVAAPAMAVPIVAAPVVAAPVVQAMPMPMPAPAAPMVMEAKVSDEAKRAMATQQQQQRDALKMQQDEQAKMLLAQQNAQMRQAQKPVKMMVQQSQPSMMAVQQAQPVMMGMVGAGNMQGGMQAGGIQNGGFQVVGAGMQPGMQAGGFQAGGAQTGAATGAAQAGAAQAGAAQAADFSGANQAGSQGNNVTIFK